MSRGHSGRRIAVSVTPLALEADSRSFRIARTLADAGFRSIVIEGRKSTTAFWNDAIEVRSLAPPRVAGGAAVSRRGGGLREGRFGSAGELALYAAYRGYDWWRHRFRAQAMIPAADLYYLHSFELHRAVAAHAQTAPIIYDAHDFYRGINPPQTQSSFDRDYLRPFFNALEEELFVRAAAIVTVSDGVADLIEAASGRRPVVIRNCHDERLDDAAAPDLRGMLGLTPADRLCVVVGNRKPGMAVDLAVEAFSQLPDNFHLVFLGHGYDGDCEKLGAGALANRIHFGHCVLPHQVVPSIRAADLGLVVYTAYSDNYRHALPNGFFQVVAAGLPLVRGALPEIENLIGGRVIGACLDPLDAGGLAQAIMQCIDNAGPLRAATAGLAAELRWETEAARVCSVIDAVLAEASPAARRGSRTHPSFGAENIGAG